MRVQRRLLMARFTMPRDVTPRRAEQHEECDGHAEGDGNIAVDARIAEQSGQVGAKVHGHVPEAVMQAIMDSSALIGFIDGRESAPCRGNL